ncbi:Pentatricopeptide repeat-containing protein, chloroplastic [Symbiodinium microadriaticum]|uniref:Pentatricopeptide repeat-containing protein, chloroplastic n=1 Tax=Symbiodinium microadriaticum TaxID=2951 RepID=A0A1Q9EBZ9_SYMMI|nr:Pentatricopeptide repeat-containing protein, chloroplastic [Symbiodinium microadriaticum]
MAFLELLGRLRQIAREELTFMMFFFCASLIGVFAILIYIVSQVFGMMAGAGIMGATAALAVLNVEAEEEADDAIEAKSQEILASFADRSRTRREWLRRRRARREGGEEDEDSGTGSEPASPSSPTVLPEGSEPFFDDGSPLPSDISDLRATLQARLKALRNLEDEAGSRQKSSAEAGGDGQAAICQEAADAVLRVLTEMRTEQIEPTTVAVNTAMRACERGSAWVEALRIFHNTDTADHTPLDVVSFTTAINACRHESCWTVALDLLFRTQQADDARSEAFDLVMWNAAIATCEKAAEWTWAMHLLRQARHVLLTPDLVTYNSTMSSLARARRWDGALALWLEMDQGDQGIPGPDAISCNSCITACGGDAWAYALRFFELLQARVLQPTTISFNALISSCDSAYGDKGHQWQRAMHIFFEDMRQHRVEANLVTFNTTIAAGEKGLPWTEAVALLERLRCSQLRCVLISSSQPGTASLGGLTPSAIAMVAEVFLLAGRMDLAGQLLHRLVHESSLSTPSVHEAQQLRLKRLVAEMRERSGQRDSFPATLTATGSKDFLRQHLPFLTKAMRRHLGFLFPNSSLLVPALTCSFAAVYVVRKLRLQVQQLERLRADVPAAEDLEDLQPSGNKSGAFEEMASPSQQHLQQQLINVLALLSLRDSFIALPAVSRSMHQIFQEEVFTGIRTNHLWPTTGGFPPPAPGDPPSEALKPSPLEVLFLWSIRERWAGFSNGAAEAPHRALQPAAGRKAPGPILWTLERFGWNDRGARALRTVLKWKADPDELDANRWTPLIWAAHLGSVIIGRLLLRAGANPDHIGAEGSSALSVACRSAHQEVVQLLLLNQASPYLVPIGNGNFDHHVGEEILEMVRQYRKLSTKRGSFVLSSS